MLCMTNSVNFGKLAYLVTFCVSIAYMIQRISVGGFGSSKYRRLFFWYFYRTYELKTRYISNPKTIKFLFFFVYIFSSFHICIQLNVLTRQKLADSILRRTIIERPPLPPRPAPRPRLGAGMPCGHWLLIHLAKPLPVPLHYTVTTLVYIMINGTTLY